MTRGTRSGRGILCGVVAAALGLLAPAVAAAAPAPAPAVQVGDFNRSPVIVFNAFYPGHLTVAKGSTVTFGIAGFHTVTFPKKGTKIPPFIVPTPTVNPATNDPAGAPYWWGGVTPAVALNGAAAAPSGGTAVTGARTVSSGLPQGRAPKFTVTFPKLGTFQVRCIIHPNMRGSVTVVPDRSKAVDTAKRARARAAREKARQRARVDRAIAKAKRTKGDTVVISPGSEAQAFAFYPEAKNVAVGSSVTFRMSGRNEVHTVSFGPDAFVQKVAKDAFQGSGLEVGSEGFYPSDPPAAGPPAVTSDLPWERLRVERPPRRSGDGHPGAEVVHGDVPSGRSVLVHLPHPPRDEGHGHRRLASGRARRPAPGSAAAPTLLPGSGVGPARAW